MYSLIAFSLPCVLYFVTKLVPAAFIKNKLGVRRRSGSQLEARTDVRESKREKGTAFFFSPGQVLSRFFQLRSTGKRNFSAVFSTVVLASLRQ